MTWNHHYHTSTKKEKTMNKMQFMLDNFKRAFPSRAARYERMWEESEHRPQEASSAATIRPKIDWTKPLKCNNSAVTNIRYLHTVRVSNGTSSNLYHVCEITYKQGYTYYVMYTDEGRTAGNNAGTINVKNVPEQVTRHYAISKFSGDVVGTANTQQEAWEIAEIRGYCRDNLTFTSHTFTR
jgi:hypothetical protein